MRYAKLDENDKVINFIKVEEKFLKEIKKELNLVKIDKDIKVFYGDIWDNKTKTFSSPEKPEEKEEKTIYDEVRELKEKLNELSQNISFGLKQ